MCIVLDTNTLPLVFNTECADHSEFAPVMRWVSKGKGFLVYGGTKYKKELKKMSRYLKLVRLLRDAHKAYEIDRSEVDKHARNITVMTRGTRCNDQHLIAILAVSGCMLLCSQDSRADEFVKDSRFYQNKRPRIYRRAAQAKQLLSDKFIVKLRHVIQ